MWAWISDSAVVTLNLDDSKTAAELGVAMGARRKRGRGWQTAIGGSPERLEALCDFFDQAMICDGLTPAEATGQRRACASAIKSIRNAINKAEGRS